MAIAPVLCLSILFMLASAASLQAARAGETTGALALGTSTSIPAAFLLNTLTTEAHHAAFGDATAPDPVSECWFPSIKGKISAFTRSTKWSSRRDPGEPDADNRWMQQAISDHRQNELLRDLSMAYSQTGMVVPAKPEGYAVQGQIIDTGPHARRASAPLARGSPPWHRAQDVLIATEQNETKRKKR